MGKHVPLLFWGCGRVQLAATQKNPRTCLPSCRAGLPVQEQHMRRLRGYLKTAVGTTTCTTWLQSTAVSWKQGPNSLVSPCSSLPLPVNSWLTAPFLEYVRTMFAGSRQGVFWQDKRPRHKIATTSGRWENAQHGPQTGLELEAMKIAAVLLGMLWKTSARTFWRSPPPPSEHRWYQQLVCCCCRSTGHFSEDWRHEFDDEDDRRLRGEYRCLRNKWERWLTLMKRKMSGSQQKEGLLASPLLPPCCTPVCHDHEWPHIMGTTGQPPEGIPMVLRGPPKAQPGKVPALSEGSVIARGSNHRLRETEDLWEWPILRNRRKPRGFLCLCTYCRRFILGFSDTLKPLTKLTEEKQAFQ